MSALGVSLHKQMLDPGSIIEVIKVTSDKLDDAASRVPDAPAGRIPDVTGIDADTAEFLTKAAGGPLGEIWAMLGAEFRLRRWKRGVRLAERAAEHLREVGREAGRVRDDTLVPLLEAGSLVDEENMQVRWGALLANAADPGADEVPPSFPEMLRQLSSIEARLLDDYYEERRPDDSRIRREQGLLTLESGMSSPPKLDAEYVVIDNLLRQRLIKPVAAEVDFGRATIHTHMIDTRDDLEITSLGIAFVQACRREPVAE